MSALQTPPLFIANEAFRGLAKCQAVQREGSAVLCTTESWATRRIPRWDLARDSARFFTFVQNDRDLWVNCCIISLSFIANVPYHKRSVAINMLTIFSLAWRGDTSADKFRKWCTERRMTLRDFSRRDCSWPLPSGRAKGGWNCYNKKSEQLSLLASLRKGRISGPILTAFLPCLYVLLTANNTHSR